MFLHIVAVLRGSRVPDKLLKQCSVLWACADYDPSRVASCRSTTTGHTGQVIVIWQPYAETCRGRNIWNVLLKIHYFREHLLVFLQTVLQDAWFNHQD
jgi:hypothetical protein